MARTFTGDGMRSAETDTRRRFADASVDPDAMHPDSRVGFEPHDNATTTFATTAFIKLIHSGSENRSIQA